MGWLEGKTALVTGGGSGLGYAIVERYLEEGANVGILEISEEGGAHLREEFGDRVTVTRGDVTSFADNERAVEETVRTFGGLDVFVGNAGIFDKGISLSALPAELAAEAFNELFEVDVLGYLLGAKAALEVLRSSNGCMIFTASCSSYMPATGGILYVPAKHAVLGLVRQLAYELAPEIRVNGVAPGYLPTNLTGTDALGQGRSDATPEDMQPIHPLRNRPEPRDYAGYYVLLASEANSSTSTGTVINADNGLSVRGF